jgi:uncharacterized protein (DUF305 family)
MAFWVRSISTAAALLSVSAAIAWAQQNKTAAGPPAIVQPGAPGQPTKTLSAKTVRAWTRTAADADVAFMQGMIMHHAQAVEMVDLLRTRGQSPELKALGERISISQTDEIQYMKQWLEDRGKPTSMSHGHMDHGNMTGMNHDMKAVNGMGDMLMPGMLTPAQMDALAKAKGAEFDHLFLTGMIQHHTGALIMVEDLFDTPGAGQDAVLFDFATDIDNTQRAEIKIMRGMLKENQQ